MSWCACREERAAKPEDRCGVSLKGIDCRGDMPDRMRRCYRCGGSVCGPCSSVVLAPEAGGRRRIRMCIDCQESEGLIQLPLSAPLGETANAS